MIRETELNLFVPSPELLVRLASGDRPLGVPAGPPRIRFLRETYFDTPDHALRRRGMTCKLRQTRGEPPTVVVTTGEGPDSEGITSRTRLTAAAIGVGVFETLRGSSEPAVTIRRIVDPGRLRPQLALDIQRLGRSFRGGVLHRPILDLYFDRITVQIGGASTTLHEVRVRRHRRGGPSVRELAQALRDRHHLFPDGLTTLQRAYRILSAAGRSDRPELSPYALSLALVVVKNGRVALRRKGKALSLPTFRGSGEDAARALTGDILAHADYPLQRVGTTEARTGRPALEIWMAPDPEVGEQSLPHAGEFVWYPWHGLVQDVGRPELRDPTLISALLLLTRRRLQGRLPWVSGHAPVPDGQREGRAASPDDARGLLSDPDPSLGGRLASLEKLLEALHVAENRSVPLEERVAATSRLARDLASLFLGEVSAAKGEALSVDEANQVQSAMLFTDVVSIRVRGILDRLSASVMDDLLPGLEAMDVQVRGWSGLMHQDRMALLRLLQERYLPSMVVAPEWGPSFLPQMPPAGCAVGIFCRTSAREEVRFLHLILGPDTPSLLAVPGSATVVPLEEVIRGFFFDRNPALERAETHFFRITTGEAVVREEPPAPATVETRRSLVTRIVVNQSMPEDHQAQLLRAMERQVSRRDALLGWPDIYPVRGPLDLSGLDALLALRAPWRKEKPSPPEGPR